jgi:peptide/nickel transport system permease protein
MTVFVNTTEPDTAPAEQPAPGRDGRFRAVDALVWLSRHWSLLIAIAVVVIVLLWAIIPGVFTHQNPLTIVPTEKFLPPSAKHWFGTDELGRDEYTRIVYGARASLIASALAVALGVVVGSLIGAVSGWFGRGADAVIMRVIDVVLSIPGFLFAIVIVVVLGFGIVQAAVAVGLTSSSRPKAATTSMPPLPAAPPRWRSCGGTCCPTRSRRLSRSSPCSSVSRSCGSPR